jgi:uncharacterized protein (TIGR00369 family)
MKYYFPHTDSCFVCSENIPNGLRLKCYYENGVVKLECFANDAICGYMGIVHGGIIATILDEVMTWAAFAFSESRRLFSTREMDIKYKKPVIINKNYIALAEFHNERKGIIYIKGSFIDTDGTIYVQSKGSYVPMDEKRSFDGLKMSEFDKDLTYHPKVLKVFKDLNIDKP